MNSTQQITSIQDCVLHAFSAFACEFVSVWDESGKILIHCNDTFSHFFGVRDKEKFKSDLTFFSLRKNKLDKELEDLIWNSIHSYGHWTEEVMLKRENESTFLGRLDITRFEHNEVTFIIQRIINIDTQRIFSENLFREIKKFEALFQYATLPILVVDKKGSIILANQQALTLFGYDANGITHLSVEDLVPSKYREKHLSHRESYNHRPENRPTSQPENYYDLLWDTDKNGITSIWSAFVRERVSNKVENYSILQILFLPMDL